jgi:hypothetical protein
MFSQRDGGRLGAVCGSQLLEQCDCVFSYGAHELSAFPLTYSLFSPINKRIVTLSYIPIFVNHKAEGF